MQPATFLILLSLLFLTACNSIPTPTTTTPTPSTDSTSTSELENSIPSNSHPASISALRTRTYQSRVINQTPASRTNHTILTYDSDGLALNALVITPSGTRPASGWPVVVVNHGYIPPTQYSTANSYINTSNYFASQGFLVLKPDYRGHDQSQGTASHLFSRSEYAIDVLNLIALIPELEGADPDNVFLYGHSMGGEVSLIAAIVNPHLRALSIWAPATKEFPENALYFSRRSGDNNRLSGLEEQLRTISPNDYDNFGSFANLALLTQPLNLQFGTRDESVPYQWGVDLNQQLEKLDKQVNFYTYPNDTHDIPNNWGTALNRDIQLFRSRLAS